MVFLGLMLAGAVFASACASIFIDDFVGFDEATGPLNDIDFETLPDGTPSIAGTLITPQFNYGGQGVEFTAGTVADVPPMIIAGNPTTGFDLRAQGDSGADVGIRIDFPSSVSAAGIFFPGNTTLTIFSEFGLEIDTVSFSGSGSDFFLGFASATPIEFAIVSRGSDIESIQSLVFSTGDLDDTPASFINDFAGFDAATGPLATIDFETLPDGQPSVAGTTIDEGFNYEAQGAKFYGLPIPIFEPSGDLIIAGNPETGFSLRAIGGVGDQMGIRIDYLAPMIATGIFFPDGTELAILDDNDNVIDKASFEGSGSGFFMGFISIFRPISHAIVSRRSESQDIQRLVFGSPNEVPVLNPGDDQMGAEGILVRLDPATFTDVDSDTHTATINWGDGGPNDLVPPANITAPNGGPGTISGAHLYEGFGVFTVTVTVTDDGFASASGSFQVTVVQATCNGLARTHLGTQNGEIIFGTPGDDVIVALGGDDTILGLEGNDIICGGPGEDFISSGNGRDWLSGQAGYDIIKGGSGPDRLMGGKGKDFLRGGKGNDRLFGQQGEDVLDGGSNDDWLVGGSGADVLLGRLGDDTLKCGSGVDFANGGPGVDTAEPTCELTAGLP